MSQNKVDKKKVKDQNIFDLEIISDTNISQLQHLLSNHKANK
jgi:hypothetical protein